MRVRDEVRAFLAEMEPAALTGGMIVAVSGGQDSCALLHALVSLSTEFPLTLYAAHLNHGLRGESADADQQFVEELSSRLGVACYSDRVDTRGSARRVHRSLQEEARSLRRRFLFRTAADLGAAHISLGHTEDDHIETVLLNIIRGSGLDGLKGLLPRSGPICRPLLRLTRQETADYCRRHGIEFREDTSNRSLRYLRNRVREELLPNLAAYYNPAIREAIKRLADLSAVDADYLRVLAEEHLARVSRETASGSIEMDGAMLGGLHQALRRRVLRLAIERVRGSLNDIDLFTVDSVQERLRGGHPFSITLPGAGTRVEAAGGVIRIHRVSPDSSRLAICVPLNVPGCTEAPGFNGRFTVDRESVPGTAPPTVTRLQAALDLDSIRGALTVRNRRTGDRIRPLGLEGTKKLQDLFVDLKVPREQRDHSPLVVDEEGILWVVGYAISERAKVTPKTRKILRIRYEPYSAAADQT